MDVLPGETAALVGLLSVRSDDDPAVSAVNVLSNLDLVPLYRLPARLLLAGIPRDGIQVHEDEALERLQGRFRASNFRLSQMHELLDKRSRFTRRKLRLQLTEEMERERARLARELHTGAGQTLAGIKLHLELIDAVMPEPTPAVRNSLHKIGLLAQEGLNQVRGISQWLHPPDWQNLSMTQSLEHLWYISGIPEKYEGDLRLSPLPMEPDQVIRIVLYRSAQETLSNLFRHSGATRVRLSLEVRNHRIELEIEDNGKGFDVDELFTAAKSKRSGIGLLSMRDHVSGLGGTLKVESEPGRTVVRISFPVNQQHD